MVTGKRTKGIRRWRHFRHFFTVADYRENPKEKQKTDLLWKICTLIDGMNKQAKDMWIPGNRVVIDEQTIDFQGDSSLKQEMGFNAMQFVIAGTHILFGFVMGRLRHWYLSSKTWSFHQQLVKLFGLLNVCQTNGQESTWTICSTT
jgi:hypothetical protein